MAQDRPIIVCWGELVVDLLPTGPRLGGCAVNVARTTAALGARARLVSAVGDDDAGRAALAELAASEVDAVNVVTLGRATTATACVEMRADGPRYAPRSELDWHAVEFALPLERALASADALVWALFAQRARLDPALLPERHEGSLIVCDLNLRGDVSRQAITSAAERSHGLQLTTSAAQRVARILGVEDAAAALLDNAQLDFVLVTDGANGARLLSPTGELVRAPRRVATPAHTVGAGDAFLAGFAHARVTGATAEEAFDAALDTALAELELRPPLE